MAKIITVNLFKGGVGKSTLTQLISIQLAKMGFKTLIIDVDPQANLTKKILRSFPDLDLTKEGTKYFYDCIKSQTFDDKSTNITENLDIIPGNWSTVEVEQLIFNYMINEESLDPSFLTYQTILANSNINQEYDFIIFDTIPTTTTLSNNCICASDYLLIPTQTEQDSLDNLGQMIDFAAYLKESYNPSLNILGIVPYLVDRSATSRDLLSEIYEDYDELVFKTHIKNSAVVKRWGTTGITMDKPYDKINYQMYDEITSELVERIDA